MFLNKFLEKALLNLKVAVFSNGKAQNTSDHGTSTLKGCSTEIPLLKAYSTIYFCEIIYNSKLKKLSIYLDTTVLFNLKVLEIDSLDLTKLLDFINGDKAYIGFTSSTGTSVQNAELILWTFCSNYSLPIDVEDISFLLSLFIIRNNLRIY